MRTYRRAGLVLVFSFIAIAVLLCSGCRRNEKIILKMNLQKGKTYTYLLTTDQQIKQTAMGQQMQIKQLTVLGYKMLVKDIDTAGNQTVETSYDRIKISQKSSFANNEYDSQNEKDTASPMAKLFRALQHSTFTMVMTKEGSIKEVKGYKEIIRRMLNSIASRSDSSREMLKEQLSMHFNEKSLKESMQSGWNIYPGRPVGIGDTWVKKSKISAGFPMEAVTTYTLKEISRKKVTLDVKTDINAGKDSATTLMGIELKIKGNQEGSMELDRSTGLPLHASIAQEVSGAISMSNQGSHLEIPVSSKSSIVIEGGQQ